MSAGDCVDVTSELWNALDHVRRGELQGAEPVVVVAAYLQALAQDRGLSEHGEVGEDPFQRAELTPPAMVLVRHVLPEVQAGDGDGLRDRLYDLAVGLSRDQEARRAVNSKRFTEVDLLMAVQVYWNLERTARRPGLPILSGQTFQHAGEEARADIRVPLINLDFATMPWTSRVTQRAQGKSSGQSFRNQGARIAVLLAQRLLDESPQPLPSLGDVVVEMSADGQRPQRVSWPATDPDPRIGRGDSGAGSSGVAVEAPATEKIVDVMPASGWPEGHPVLVGNPAGIAASYQRRDFDDEIERLWSESGDRRIWLRGGPGTGKSYSARRIMHEALAEPMDNREELLIWVDSATRDSLIRALSDAVDRMPYLGISATVHTPDRQERQARALLQVLAVSGWRWLIVLDNADAGELIEAALVPPGGNASGRVLITTLSQDHRITSHGHLIRTGSFTPSQAGAFLRAQRDPRDGAVADMAKASDHAATALMRAVDYHPLALSIAAATIMAHRMEVADWIEEFTDAHEMDVAADASDAGGYPHLIGNTWRLALDRAAHGLPDGVVARAALVAAVLDPDGHPTWLWGRDQVRTWVGGESGLAASHGIPVAVQRLIDVGVLELVGDSWKSGRLAIHQLAARAVREHAGADEVAALAQVLLETWLIRLVEDESPEQLRAMRTNIAALTALPGLSLSTDPIAVALLNFQARDGAEWIDELHLEMLKDESARLERGGSFAGATLARAQALVKIGDLHERLGRPDQASEARERAAHAFRQVVTDRALGAASRAAAWRELGALYVVLGHIEQAREAWRESVASYQALLKTTIEDSETLRYVTELVVLHESLDQRFRGQSLLAEYYEVLERAVETSTPDPDADAVSLLRWRSSVETLVSHQVALGHYEDAIANIAWAAQVLGDDVLGRWDAERRKAAVFLAAHQWESAEEQLALLDATGDASTDDLTRLASLRYRLQQADGAHTALTSVTSSLLTRPSEDSTHERREVSAMLRETFQDVAQLGLVGLGNEALRSASWDEAAALFEASIDLTRERGEGDPLSVEDELSRGFMSLGIALFQAGRLTEAVEALQQSVAIKQTMAELDPDADAALDSWGHGLFLLGIALNGLGRLDDAAEALGQAMDLQSVTLKSGDASGADRFVHSLQMLASIHGDRDEPERALECVRRAISLRESALESEPGEQSQLDLAEVYSWAGEWCLQKADLRDEAEKWLLLATETYRQLPSGGRVRGHARAFMFLGLGHGSLGRQQEAAARLNEAVEIFRALADQSPDDLSAQHDLALALVSLAYTHAGQGDFRNSVAKAVSSVEIMQLVAELEPSSYEPHLLVMLKAAADVLERSGKADESARYAERADELEQRLGKPDEE